MKLLLFLLVFLSIFLVFVAVALPFLMGDSHSSRIKAIRKQREAFRANLRANLKQQSPIRERFMKKTISQKIAAKMNLGKLVNMTALKTKMQKAGWRDSGTPARFLVTCLVLPIVCGFFSMWVAYDSTFHNSFKPLIKPLFVAGCFGAGLGSPWLMLKNAAQKRAEALGKQFPEALDLLLVCVEAGLSVEQAFMRITREIGHTIPEMGDELALTGAELAFLGDRRNAYDNLVARNDCPAFKALCTALIQSERYGTSVSHSLRVLSDQSRKERTNAVEKKAASLGPKMTIPMIMFVLPCLFLVLLGPAVITIITRHH